MASAAPESKTKPPVIIVHQPDTRPDSYSCCSTSDEEEENHGCAMHVGRSYYRPRIDRNSSETNFDDISASLFDIKDGAQTPNNADPPDHKNSNGLPNSDTSATPEIPRPQYSFDVQSYINSLRTNYSNSNREQNEDNNPAPELSLSGVRTPTDDVGTRNANLTHYSSPGDVLRRVMSRKSSTERRSDEKPDFDYKEDLKETEFLREQITSRNLTIKNLRDELRRMRIHKDHLEKQLCESDNFIERRVAELSMKSDDSQRHWQITKDDNSRLRQEAETKETIILDLRDQVRRLEIRLNQTEAEKAELHDKLRVANEVIAAHQTQLMLAPRSNSPSAPLKHENDLLRQQVERQDREITSLRRELGPARLIFEGRNRKTANDKLNVLLESMETTTSPVDMNFRHDIIIQRAKEALNNLDSEKAALAKSANLTDQLIEQAFSKPVHKLSNCHMCDLQINHSQNQIAQRSATPQMEQRLYEFLSQEEQQEAVHEKDQLLTADLPEPLTRVDVPEILADSYSPCEVPRLERRSPSVERLLAKYQGGPTSAVEQSPEEYEKEEFDDGEPSPRPDVTVYSLGRKIHDAELGRTSKRDDCRPRQRPKSADIFRSRIKPSVGRYSTFNFQSPNVNKGLWKDQPKEANRWRSSEDPSPRGSKENDSYIRPSSSMSNGRYGAKTYANSLIERYIADRRR